MHGGPTHDAEVVLEELVFALKGVVATGRFGSRQPRLGHRVGCPAAPYREISSCSNCEAFKARREASVSVARTEVQTE